MCGELSCVSRVRELSELMTSDLSYSSGRSMLIYLQRMTSKIYRAPQQLPHKIAEPALRTADPVFEVFGEIEVPPCFSQTTFPCSFEPSWLILIRFSRDFWPHQWSSRREPTEVLQGISTRIPWDHSPSKKRSRKVYIIPA